MTTRARRARGRPRRSLIGLSLAGLLFWAGQTHPIHPLAAEDATPSADRTSVIAAAVLDVPEGSVAWSVAAIEAGARATALPGDGEPGFLVATQGAASVDGGEEDETRLDRGEALPVRPEDDLRVRSAGASPARLALLTLGQAAADDADADGRAGEPFTSPGGSREVELLREELDEGTTTEIEAGEAAAFVLVTGGSVSIETEEGEPMSLKAGETALVEGQVAVTGAAEQASSYVAVVIGDEVDREPGAASPTPAGGGQSGPRPTAPARPTAPPAIPTPTPSGNGPNEDPDGDDLVNQDEDAAGSDRLNPDTDGDLLNDGVEVFTFGTSPTALDSDFDGLYDGDEAIRTGTNPAVADGDRDSLQDGIEVNELFTNPHSPDTDGDGLHDSDEALNVRTNPSVFDTDGDGYGDGDEWNHHGTNPHKADTDDDGLRDAEELFLGTSPRNPDSDGDGYSDGAEVHQYHTWPTDPNSHP